MRTFFLAAILLIFLGACSPAALPPPEELGRLVVVVREGPNTYQIEANGRSSGFEHDLVSLFAAEMGLEVRFILAHSDAELADVLQHGRAHMAAANLSPTGFPELRFVRIGGPQWRPPSLDLLIPPEETAGADQPAPVSTTWVFPAAGEDSLRERARAFLVAIRHNGKLDRLIDRYFGHVQRLDGNDVSEFLARMHSVLPRYQRDFVEAQAINGIDWRLLAALAYQESHWDPLATSYTNVRGMMMLTEETADRLRVSDRLDARQSILAGARYLAELREQVPPETPEPDRTWLAIAAYNLGMGHLNGSRFIASLVKRDPNSWFEMKKVLPLLSQPEYYSRLKSGAGRGGEAVIMTENVRTYFDLLRRFEKPTFEAQALSMDASPPMYGLNAAGTSTLPSAR